MTPEELEKSIRENKGVKGGLNSGADVNDLFEKTKGRVVAGARIARTMVENSPAGVAVKSAVDFVQDPKFKENMTTGLKTAVKEGMTPLPVAAAKLGERLGNNPQVQEIISTGKEVLAEGMQKAKDMIDTVRGAIPESVKQASIQAVETTSPLIGALRRGVSIVGRDQDQSRKLEEPISR